jgi:hypothetical protein
MNPKFYGGLMGNERLLEYIGSLSDEEREQYRDLIEEALQRDRTLSENLSKIEEYVRDLSENLALLVEEALQVQQGLTALNETLLEVSDASQMIAKVFSRGPVWN